MKKVLKTFNLLLALTLMSVAVGLIIKNRYSHTLELLILTIVVLSYLCWAYAYHKKDKSLTYSLYLEYLLTAALAMILLLGIFNI